MAIFDIVIQSAILSAISNVLAQLISAYQSKTSYSNISLTPIIQFIIYSILNTPINCVWQNKLEEWFPSSKPVPVVKEKGVEKPAGLDIQNTLIKFALDQTVGAGVNIPLFIGIMGLLKGHSVHQIVGTVQRDFMEIYISGAKLWPLVSLVSFAALPAHRRVIFGSLAGVVWNIYLSLMAK